MIVIFSGAGASRAVSATRYPTTKEFFENLPGEIKSDQMFGLIVAWLKTRFGVDAALDIEQVLWALLELREFVRRISDKSALEGWFLQGSRLISPVGLNSNFRNLTDPAPKVLDLIDELIGRTNERVFDWYSQEPNVDELEQSWFPLLRPILSTRRHVELFTTNYDLVLETAVEVLAEQNSLLSRIQTGRAGRVKHFLDDQLWLRPPRGWDWSPPGGKLTKLHGSVDWTRGDDSRIYVGDPTFKGAHKKQVILYPGFKGRPDAEPFIAFHSYLQDCLQAAECVIFIGFAFRDEFINDIVERSLAPRARIVIVNPVEDIEVPFEPRRVERICEFFCSDVAEKLASTLL